MSDMDELFGGHDEKELHPSARAWLSRLRSGQSATVEVVRKRSGLSYGPVKLYITFETPNGPEVQHDDWDPHLNEVLSNEKVKAHTTANEALRLALMFEEWFQYLALRYGDDYFNAVLVEYVCDSSLRSSRKIAELLPSIRTTSPSRSHADFGSCWGDVKTVLARGAKMLLGIGYPREEQAESILASALAQYLDDRFGVANQRMLGLL